MHIKIDRRKRALIVFHLSLFSKLLRLLQDKELRRLGSNKVIKIDVRYIAATNRNLQLISST